jgi:glyoxylase-like metal-dependent hydrolase (beta-lactamase superfamily II)
MRHHLTELCVVAGALVAPVMSPATRVSSARRIGPSAHEIVLASAEAIGGVDRLRSIRGVRVEEVGSEYLISTVTRRDAPPRMISQTIATLRSAADSSMRRTLVQVLPMRAGTLTSTTIVSHGAAAVVRGKGLVPASVFDLETSTEELLLSPERVLLTALDAKDLRLERDTTIGAVRHHVVSLGIGGARVRLFMDAASGFPTKLELVRAYPSSVFWAMWGDLTLITTWSAWAMEQGGVWYPRQRSVSLNGAAFRAYVVSSLDLAAAPAPDSLAIPDSVRAVFASVAARQRLVAERGTLPTLTPSPIASNAVLYQGGYQSAAVKQADGVVIIEAPESSAKSKAVLADIATRWPGTRVKAVITTSPMWMHIGGLREYAARRVPIYALDVNVPVVRSLLSAPYAQAPDSLAKVRVAPVIRSVGHLTTIGQGAERLELRPARGQHSSSMMVVYLPDQRLLYASDVVLPDAFEPVFAAGYWEELARVVKREGLTVERLFAEHLPATPWGDRAR